MPLVVACAGCRNQLTVAESPAAYVVGCPWCRRPVAVPAAPPADPFAAISAEPESRPARSARPRSLRPLFVALGVAAALVAAALLLGRGAATAERDRDYHEILDLSYDIQAALVASKFWISDYRKWPGMDDFGEEPRPGNEVFLRLDGLYHVLDAEKLQKRKAFVARHAMEWKDWKPEFVKRHPERDVIFDEIEAAVKRLTERQADALSAHLSTHRGRTDFRTYRLEYVRRETPRLVQELRDEVRKLESAATLRARFDPR